MISNKFRLEKGFIPAALFFGNSGTASEMVHIWSMIPSGTLRAGFGSASGILRCRFGNFPKSSRRTPEENTKKTRTRQEESVRLYTLSVQRMTKKSLVGHYDTPKSRSWKSSYLWRKQAVQNEADKKNPKFWASRVWLLDISKLKEMASPVAKYRLR